MDDKFLEQLQETLDEDCNLSMTENGAIGYATTCKPLLDLNFAVSSLRNLSETEIEKQYAKAFYESKLLAIKWLFFAADVRGGMGERRLFRVCLRFLAQTEPAITVKLLPLVAEYTRWDNLLCLLDTSLKDEVCSLLKGQLDKDVAAMQEGKPVSLCAKWLPSVNATSPRSKSYAKLLIRAWNMTEKSYRKTLSALRAYLKVVEVDMSKKAWGNIDYSAVPSRANLLYAEAFLRNDKDRREAYLQQLERGEEKINAGVLFPHDIVHKYTTNGWNTRVNAYDPTLEELWKALPDYVQGQGNTICVADGSGSMTITVGGTNVSCLSVANALAIYFSERSSGALKDKYITFSRTPKFVNLARCKSLHDKIGKALAHDEVEDTNVEAVFDLILATAIKHKMKQSDMPKNVLILSDMEFNHCCTSNTYGAASDPMFERLFKVIGDKYKQHGYLLPRLIFWNICSRSMTVPLRENELGVALVSGFSPAVMQMVLSGELDPFKCLLEQLNKERYQPIEDALKDIL
ncbi:MAG: DUF2828 family protein [Clostridia bacterium]|nr:DUF2828 family protein [Clostridia bacterium]